jgi:hypothetical protein
MAGSKTGYCSICKHPKVKIVNEVIAGGGSFNAALDRASEVGWAFAKGTFFKHKEHATSSLLTDADKARKNPVIPQSNKAVLEAIRDLGMRKALEDPDSVTVNQALRAASILAEKESKQEGVLVVLAKALQGRPPEVIEGEYEVLPRLEMKEAEEIAN